MNRLSYCLLTLLSILLLNCQPEDPVVPPVDVRVTLTFDGSFGDLPAKAVEVKLENIDTKQSFTAVSGETGLAEFKQMAAGVYNITARRTFQPADYLTFAGLSVKEPVVFQASALNQTINQASNTEHKLVLKAGTTGDLVIKQIYYAGSDRTDGATFRDQFIEIYNNSDQTLYADGLYFGQIDGNRTIPTGTRPAYLLPSNQYDWSKSIGMPATVKANDDYVYTRTLFQLPGTGQQYPIEPGKSVVIAQTALNHKSPFTGNDGKPVTAKNPDLTIDLSNATFEAFYNKGLDSDIDNPAVPNIRAIQTFGNDMILDNSGRDGYVIFRSPTDAANLPKYPRPNTTAISSTTVFYYQIPKTILLDAIETQESVTQQIPKKFTAELDAGFTFVPKGSYTSQSVIRKTARTFGSRRVLQDTNNSTDNFTALDLPKPFGF